MFKNVIYGDRRSGKSTALVDLVVTHAVSNPESKILFITPNIAASFHLVNYIQTALEKFDSIDSDIKSMSTGPQHEIVLWNGSVISFRADLNHIKGFVPDFIAVDEATHVNGLNEFLESIEPVANENLRCWMTASSEKTA